MALAHTKTRVPRPRAGLLLPRPGLLAAVARALDEQRVLLICAPAGYGKTALLTQALAAQPEGTAVAWVALDEGDDLGRLLDCLFSAFEPFDPPWRTAPEGLRDAALRGGAELTTVADAMLNALQACEVERGLIVLDDVHHLADAASMQFLDRWLARMGERWSLVLAARHEPALRLARLRASGELADLGPAQLALAREESEQLARNAGVDARTAAELHERCHGWPAGLRLALGAGRGQHLPAAIDRATFDYLASEVLDRLEPGLRGFLLRTSVFFELDAARCRALGEAGPVESWLAEIERQALFVTVVDLAPLTLRLHQLLRDMLRQRLRQDEPALRLTLLARAGELETDPVRRQGLLLAAGQPERAAALLLADGAVLLNQLGAQGLLDLAARFDAAFAEHCPELHRVRAMALWVQWEAGRAEWHLERAESLLAARGDAAALNAARAHRAVLLVAQGRLDDVQHLLGRLDAQPLDADGRRARRLADCWLALEGARFDAVAPHFEAFLGELLARPTVEAWYTGIPAPRQVACRGMAPLVDRWFRGAMAAIGDRPLPLGVMAQTAQGWNCFWRGQLDDARRLLERAEADGAWCGRLVSARNHALALRGMLHLVAGEPQQALALLQQRVAEHVPGYGPWGLWHTLYFAARVAAATGQAAVLASSLDELRRLGAGLSALAAPHRVDLLLGMEGQQHAVAGRLDAAMAAWQRQLDGGDSGDLLGQLAETRVRLAEAWWRRGDRQRAADVLVPALDMHAPAGLMWVLPQLDALLAQDWDGRLNPADVAHWQAWLAKARHAAMPVIPAPGAAPAADELLTSRETEVVALIAGGASNKHIARALELSPHTVKRHVANILDKLALNSRSQAASWWSSRQPGQAATRPGTGA